MTAVNLTKNFLGNARGLTIADGGGVTWAFNKNTNTLTVSGISGVGIAPGSVSNADLANMNANTIKGNNTGSPAAPSDLTAAQVKTLLAISYTDVSGLATVAHTGAYSDLSGTPTIPSAANPTAKVGLTAVNGSAATYMRSDGAPALDVSIGPTWTGLHIFTPASGSAQTILVNALANQNAVQIQGNSTSGQSFGLVVNAGTTAGDYMVRMLNQAATATYFEIFGDGHGTLGPSASVGLSWTSAGAMKMSSTFAINGGTPTAALSGFGSPSGTPTASLTNAATLAQTAGTLAALLAYLKTIGFIAA